MRGFTLIELTVVLALLSVTAAAFAAPARRYRDRHAVTAAVDATVALLSRARFEAIARGGAVVALEPDPWRARLEAGGEAIGELGYEADWGVAVEGIDGDAAVRIRYGPLGLGVVASRTLVFRRGDAESRVLVSSLGRGRRR